MKEQISPSTTLRANGERSRTISADKKDKVLVIVESPTKARTLARILGKNFLIRSSMGHLIDLPKKKMGVDIKNNFIPSYVVIPGKQKIIRQLKKDAKISRNIYLATDPDREGEAISWHIAQKLDKDYLRVVFHEITERAVKEAFKNPGKIDLNKVNAQQARRILDRIVGYLLSPLLWRKLAAGLSAGRVQSVALRLIVEREKEIKNFVPQEYWEIEAELKKQGDAEAFIAKLERIDNEKLEIKNKQQAIKVVSDLKDKEFIVKDIKQQEKRIYPSAPFTTSTLQQESFNRLRFTSQKTMFVAQQLYEGIELGEEGSIGLITYMRTDSVRVSEIALKEVRRFIRDNFDKEYLPPKPNIYKSRKGAQEAHEAIRPTFVEKKPEDIKRYLTLEQFKLYEIIWRRFLASQMSPALIQQTTVWIAAEKYSFKATGSQMLFDGFKTIYNIDKEEKILPILSAGEELVLIRLTPTQHFTKPPPRFSDASLVKTLEEKEIGRPSTYAPIIHTIILRNYVRRIKNYLYPTELGIKVTELLVRYFPKTLDLRFTAKMEAQLDEIEEGSLEWQEVLKSFYQPFMQNLSFAQKNIKKEVIPTDQICEKCGRKMVIKWARFGKFLSCSGFPDCKNAKAISSGVKCPEDSCDGELIQRRSKRGLFFGCSNFPKCRYTTKKLPQEEEEVIQ